MVLDEFKNGHIKKGDKVLIPSSNIARDVIQNGLIAMGAEVKQLAVYNTKSPDYSKEFLEELFQDKIDAITFTSSSTVDNFIRILNENGITEFSKEIKAASIGPITSETLKKHKLNIICEADLHTIEGLVEGMIEYFNHEK